MNMDYNHKKVIPFTLVLGGGGARGLAHIGILKALEINDFVPTFIVGTSMGALVGAMYSQLRNADAVETKIRDYLQGDSFKQIGLEQFSDTDDDNSHSLWERFSSHLRQRYFLSKSMFGTGTFAQETLLQAVRKLLGNGNMQELSLPFAAVASDLVTGEEVVFTSGPIDTAVTASCAVLGIVAPIKKDSRQLIDGTVTSTIPVPAARSLSSDPVIAVDVRQSLDNFTDYNHGYEIFIRASDITRSILNDIHLKQASIILKPDVANLNWNEFSCIDQCIHSGEQAVEENLSKLSRILIKRPFRFFPWQ